MKKLQISVAIILALILSLIVAVRVAGAGGANPCTGGAEGYTPFVEPTTVGIYLGGKAIQLVPNPDFTVSERYFYFRIGRFGRGETHKFGGTFNQAVFSDVMSVNVSVKFCGKGLWIKVNRLGLWVAEVDSRRVSSG